jgi:steroid 5-alpha reductase family enzyme
MRDVNTARLLLSVLANAVAVAVLMAATMVTALRIGKQSIVDVVWGLGFGLVAVVSFVLSAGTGDGLRRALVLVMPVVWGLRLAVHIGRRNAGRPEDPRYEELFSSTSGSAASVVLRKVYLPQGLAMLFVSLPIPVAAVTVGGLQWWAWAGVLVWAVGVFFETVGDYQLSAFRADPGNRGKLMDRGLWRYTRHPNYFGDACVWWGIWLVAAASWVGLATVVCPAAMTYLLTAKTGKALMEKGLSKSKPGYAQYVARTSGFLPLPPKRLPPDRPARGG